LRSRKADFIVLEEGRRGYKTSGEKWCLLTVGNKKGEPSEKYSTLPTGRDGKIQKKKEGKGKITDIKKG